MQSLIEWEKSNNSEIIIFFGEDSERVNDLCINCVNYYPEWQWQS